MRENQIQFNRGLISAFALFMMCVLSTGSASALQAPEGWSIAKTPHSFEVLVEKVTAAIKINKMGLVTQASASAGAASRDITIAGNRVMGVYSNDFAVRMLEASVASGIEAPIRFYLTENADKTATLSYIPPSVVFAPYMSEGGEALKTLADELDVIFLAIFNQATGVSK